MSKTEEEIFESIETTMFASFLVGRDNNGPSFKNWYTRNDYKSFFESTMKDFASLRSKELQERVERLETELTGTLYALWNDDFEKYPLPICFDPREEQKELYGRDRQIKKEVEIFVSALSGEATKENKETD